MLVVDVGGTYTRVGILKEKKLNKFKIYKSKDFKDLYSLLEVYKQHSKIDIYPKEIFLAVAGPVIEKKAKLSNVGWEIEEKEIRRRFGFEKIILVNDLFSLALGFRFISRRYIKTLKKGDLRLKLPKVFIAPGTGLGEAVLIDENPIKVIPTEAGHSFFPCLKMEEFEFIEFLKKKEEELSWEKALSGPALTRWYEFYFKENLSSEQICENAKKHDKKALKVIVKILELLGRKASQAALNFLPYGGIYLTGGLIKGLLFFLEKDEFKNYFLEGFFANKKMEYLLEKFSIKIISHPYPVLLGALAIHHNQLV